MATPKQFRRRGRWFLIIGTIIAALAIVGVTLATTFQHVTYTPLGGTATHQSLPASPASDPGCTAAELAAAGTGELWHFVLTSTTATNTGSLRAEFQSAGVTVPDVHFYKQAGGTTMWDVVTPTTDTLLNFSTDAVGDNLNLSHVCFGSTIGLTTTASIKTPGTGVTGDTFLDTAHLTGGPISPTGTITFRLYNFDTDGTCSSTALDTEHVTTASGASDYSTPTGFVIPSKGTYTWTAEYTDGTNDIGPTTCGDVNETLLFDASTPDIETAIHFGSSVGEATPPTLVVDSDGDLIPDVPLGSTVHDSATATGGPSVPQGSIAFTFYTTINCSTDATHPSSDAGTVALNASGVAHPSLDETALHAGSYSFQAVYTSNDLNIWANNTSLCEKLIVNKAGTTTPTSVVRNDTNAVLASSPIPHLPLGTSVHDTATVGTQVGTIVISGTVTYHFYNSIDCTTGEFTPTPPWPQTVTMSGGLVPNSQSTGALAPGSYGFQAVYGGDSNYKTSTGDCEPFIIDKGNLTLTTYIHDSLHNVVTSVPVNGTVHDTARFGGAVSGFTPTAGNVSFTFYNTIDCSTGGQSATNTGADEKTTPDPRTQDEGPLPSGAYSFNASFSGDTNYNPVPVANVACEPLHVRTFGYTMGFWGNRNGQALLATNNAFFVSPTPPNPPTKAVTLGIGTTGVTTTCWVLVDSATKSLTIFPNTLNGISILTNCTTSTKLDSGINTASLNTLLAQTLALSYNNLYKSGFTGQTIGAMGCTAFSPLTSSSTTQDVQTYANYLIANAIKGVPTVTQSQIGAMNTLLGCMNTESA